jgi:hypothetical protein
MRFAVRSLAQHLLTNTRNTRARRARFQKGKPMSRPRYRVQLESGPKLDINRLMRNMRIAPGSKWSTSMTWSTNYTGEKIARALIVFDIPDEQWGSCEIRLGDRVQYLTLEARPRHFGGASGTLYVQSRAVAYRFFGCRQGPGPSLVARRGDAKSRMARNFSAVPTERTGARRRSTRDCALWAASTRINGILRPNQNGCGGRHTIVLRRSLMSTSEFSMTAWQLWQCD